MKNPQHADYNITIESELDKIPNIIETTLNFARQHEISCDPFDLEISVREAITNCLLHGNQEAADKKVFFRLFVEQGALTVQIEDEGIGFDWRTQMSEEPDPSNPHGRGLSLIKAYCDILTYNEKGNAIEMTFNASATKDEGEDSEWAHKISNRVDEYMSAIRHNDELEMRQVLDDETATSELFARLLATHLKDRTPKVIIKGLCLYLAQHSHENATDRVLNKMICAALYNQGEPALNDWSGLIEVEKRFLISRAATLPKADFLTTWNIFLTRHAPDLLEHWHQELKRGNTTSLAEAISQLPIDVPEDGREPDQKGLVFIVDDSRIILKMMSKNLIQLGYDCRCFPMAEEALKAFAYERPILVFTDLNMPGMNGLQLVDQLRKDHSEEELPIILMTTPEEIHHDETAGINDILPKPFNKKTVQRITDKYPS